MKPIEDSELILNGDGTVFHLHLLPENIADNIILVGDQDRTDVVASAPSFPTRSSALFKNSAPFKICDSKNALFVTFLRTKRAPHCF